MPGAMVSMQTTLGQTSITIFWTCKMHVNYPLIGSPDQIHLNVHGNDVNPEICEQVHDILGRASRCFAPTTTTHSASDDVEFMGPLNGKRKVADTGTTGSPMKMARVGQGLRSRKVCVFLD